MVCLGAFPYCGVGGLEVWGRQASLQYLALHALGPARDWQEACGGAAGSVL